MCQAAREVWGRRGPCVSTVRPGASLLVDAGQWMAGAAAGLFGDRFPCLWRGRHRIGVIDFQSTDYGLAVRRVFWVLCSGAFLFSSYQLIPFFNAIFKSRKGGNLVSA